MNNEATTKMFLKPAIAEYLNDDGEWDLFWHDGSCVCQAGMIYTIGPFMNLRFTELTDAEAEEFRRIDKREQEIRDELEYVEEEIHDLKAELFDYINNGEN